MSTVEDEISLVEIGNAVLRNWRVVVILPVLLALTAMGWSMVEGRTYAVTASFMPQTAEGRGQSSAAALAQQFGVSLGNERPGQSPAFYVDLLMSRRLLRKAVEEDYEVPIEQGRVWKGTLIQYWELEDAVGSVPPWRQATEALRDAISISIKQETGVVELTVLSSEPLFAERIAERLLELLSEFNLEIRRSRAQEEADFISGRMQEAHAELMAAENSLEQFLRQNRGFENSPELVFEHDRLQRQVMMRQEVYTSMLRSQEQLRIDALRDTPLFTVIDYPAGAAEPAGRGGLVRVVLAFLLGLLLSFMIAFAAEFARRKRAAEDQEYIEFRRLARQAWDDLRQPRQWLRRGDKSVGGR